MTAVLIVEDEKNLAEGLRFNLEAEGYQVDIASDGESALDMLMAGETQRYDVVVLDVMLPGKDGFAVALDLRKARQFIPVLMLTARGRPEDVLRGFEAGADDYLAKPFELAILMARLRGLLRRREWLLQDRETTTPAGAEIRATETKANLQDRDPKSLLFHFNRTTFDFGAPEIRAEDKVVPLTLMEAKLLYHLVRHAGQSVSRKSILQEVWGLQENTDTRAIDNFIVRLRKYIEVDPSRPRHLLTVRGVGYRFVPGPSK